MIDFIVEPIEDFYTRENFQKLLAEFGRNPFLRGSFRVYEAKALKADASFKIIHGLSFTPTDVFVTNISNSSLVVPVFQEITNKALTFNVSAPCEFRCLAGSFR